MYLKYDNMHTIGVINALICINSHVNSGGREGREVDGCNARVGGEGKRGQRGKGENRKEESGESHENARGNWTGVGEGREWVLNRKGRMEKWEIEQEFRDGVWMSVGNSIGEDQNFCRGGGGWGDEVAFPTRGRGTKIPSEFEVAREVEVHARRWVIPLLLAVQKCDRWWSVLR